MAALPSALLYRLRYKLLGDRLLSQAVRSWELAPASDEDVAAVLHDPAEVERVRGSAVEETIEEAVAKLGRRRVHHLATVAHELHDVSILDGDLYGSKGWMPIRSGPVRAWSTGPRVCVDEAVLVSSRYGIRYFGHWMHDDLPRALAAQDLGLPALSVLTSPTPSQTSYLQHLGLEPIAVDTARVGRLIVLEDAGQNAYRRQRYMRLRELARRGVATPAAHRGVYVLRGRRVVRQMVNEPEVVELVRSMGLQVLDPLATPAAEIVRICAGASLAVGVEGSQMMNALMWMSPGSALVALHPPQHFNLTLKDYCDCVGIRVASHIGLQSGDNSFRAEVARVRQLIETLAPV